MLTLPPPFVLRAMCEADLTAVYDIDRASFPTPARKGIFEHELKTNEIAHYQVLCEQREVIGFAGYWLIADEVHISTIAVHPEKRGCHLGELLLLGMLFDACNQPASMITLEVRRSNYIAQKLYQKYRFEQVGERHRYYKDTGEDALIMTVPALDASYQKFLISQQQQLADLLPGEVSRP